MRETESRDPYASIACHRNCACSILALFLIQSQLARAQSPAPVENVSSLPPRTPADERKALHVPAGFEIQLVASEPDIHKPLNLAFDDRGRLWVTEHGRISLPGPRQGTRPRDTVKILSDFQADGRAKKIETFADGLNIPIGLLPLPSARAALVHNIPNIYLMTDVRWRRPSRYARRASMGSSAIATRTA